MTDWDPLTEAEIFSGIVPDGVNTAYGRLLAARRIPVPEAADALGGDDIVRELTRFGMAYPEEFNPAEPPFLVANSPALALQGVMATHVARLAAGVELLHTATSRAADAHDRHCTSDDPGHLVTLYTDPDEIVGASAGLINAARKNWMTLNSAPRDTPLSETSIEEPPEEIRGSITCRAIYDQDSADDPDTMHILRERVRRGHQIRILPRIHMKMQIADTTAVLVALSTTGMRGAAMVHAQTFSMAMREYFELLWGRAVPLGHTGTRSANLLDSHQQQVLDFLVGGHEDAWIAQELGWHISWVRRRVHEIQEKLGARSREQAFFIAGAHSLANRLPNVPAPATSSENSRRPSQQ